HLVSYASYVVTPPNHSPSVRVRILEDGSDLTRHAAAARADLPGRRRAGGRGDAESRDRMIRVAVLGIGGRMGGRIAAAVRAEPDLRIGAATERPDSPHIGRDAGAVAGFGEAGAPVSPTIDEALARGGDGAIQFTAAAAAG